MDKANKPRRIYGKYSESRGNQICDLIAEGKYPINSILKMVNVPNSSYYDWRRKYPHFLEKVKIAQEKGTENFKSEGKELSRKALLKLIEGIEYEETTTEWVNDGNGKPKVKSQKKVKKYTPPNVAAAIFMLTNTDSENFKNRINSDVTSKGERVGFTDFLIQTSSEANSEGIVDDQGADK